MVENSHLSDINCEPQANIDAAIISLLHDFAKMNLGSMLKYFSKNEYMLFYFVDRMEKLKESDCEGIHVSTIARLMEVSSPAISRTLNSLEEKHYIIRRIDETNRRSINVKPTESGRTAFAEDSERISELAVRVSQRMGKQQLQMLVDLAGKLSHIMNEEIINICDMQKQAGAAE